MTAANTSYGADDGDAHNIRLVFNADASSILSVEVDSDDNLYIVTPPAYTQSIADGEVSVDAEAMSEEKPPVLERSTERDVLAQQSILANPTGPTPELLHHLTAPVATAALVGARACSILHDRPAIWLVKRDSMALSPLAATVLTKEGLVNAKDFRIPQHASTRRDPTDPLSGVLLSAYDTVGEIMLGLVAGPVELGRQATPVLTRYELEQGNNQDGNSQSSPSEDLKGAPHAAAKVAIETGKGLGRIVTAGLKTPMLTTHGLTRGFHNLPKLYGEEVREYENVTGLKSGLLVSAKSFGYGLGDGLLDLVAKPIQGAERDGIVGLASGFAKGIGNAVCKPVAGACGLVGYSSVGVYKSIRNIKLSEKSDDAATLVRRLGEAEYERATDADKEYVVRIWRQIMMQVPVT